MGDAPPTVSVVLATYQGGRFLADQLASILAQTVLPDQIVVSDDGSTDDTLAIVERYRRQSPPTVTWTVVSRNGSDGPAGNFAHGVSLATSVLVALCDQDDRWRENKIEVLRDILFGNARLMMVHSDADLIDEDGVPLGMTVLQSLRITGAERRNLSSGRGLRALVRRNLVTGQTVMMRKTLAEVAGPIPPGWLHDEWWALVAASHRGIQLFPASLQDYRQHAHNQVGATRSGLARLFERFSEPQGAFRARHLTRHEGLADYLDTHRGEIPADSITLLEGRLAHYRWQAKLRRPRIARFFPILGRLVTGSYHRYRRGAFDALRDFLQPAE